MTLFEFVTYITYLVPVLLIILIVYAGTKTPFNAVKFALLGYLITSLAFYFMGEFLGKVYRNNLILIPIFGVVELAWFSLIYRLITTKKLYYLINLPALICLIYELNTINFHLLIEIESYTRFTSTFTLLLLAIFYCFNLLKNRWRDYHPSFFLLNATLLIYASFSCIYYLPLNLLINGKSENKFLFWLVNLIITLLFYIINTKILCNIPGKEKTSS
ncbi:hypothetical protein HX004_14670 [Myroides sp. 1354]|uniref:hypothetical protein n=1 Tax=unclassified Myroides TaxID=2642485 RepID=UPI002578EAA0|nr:MULTISPECIES: hypothetical protein [unclassified Myroides]MDM1046071.1 hypothetical protein [Myroides sp. R163-1]MDM1057007.1 hypothetical protein [Myroides sp. 1354]MDM1070202.1 hypothetical protein [Myroides sp. 1372]